jgi:basic amino acid/polyamine antiporter, APA family
VARKLPQLQRRLGAADLFGVAYGEIASSIYFALGIIAAHALGFTPYVLLFTGVVFLVVALSYAEGTTELRETGGAATFVRRAFNDLAGFVAGWSLFLDYLIVTALAALFLPHYLGGALAVESLESGPWDRVVALATIGVIGVARLTRRRGAYAAGLGVTAIDLFTQALLVVLGLAFLWSPDALTRGVSLGTSPSWHEIAFALPLAMLAYTGLETVANLAEETRRPGVQLPKSLFTGIGAVVVMYVGIAVVGLMAFPPRGGTTALGTEWGGAPLMGIVAALDEHLPGWLHVPLRVYVGLSGAFILLLAAATSISGFGRLAYSLGEHGQLPRAFGRLHRRTLVSPQSVLAAVGISMAIIVLTSLLNKPVQFLASLFSFGVLLAFTAAQVAVIKLRKSEPQRRRPFKVPLNVRVRGVEVPIPSVVGALATFAIWIDAMATHPAARYAGPAWLAAGLVVYLLVRRDRHAGLFEHVVSTDEQVVPEVTFTRILVPMKLGQIGEEMVATAVKLAQERNAVVEALHVIKVPLELPVDAPLEQEEARAAESLAEAEALGADHGVVVQTKTVRARSLGEAIVKQAVLNGADLIVLGSAPRWRRQSRFFSPTVDYVLKKAPCEVIVVAFPQGALEEEPEEPALAPSATLNT